MTTRLDNPPVTGDPVIRAVLVLTAVITIVGVLALVRATVGSGVDHLTVRVENRAGLTVQVDALDASGARVGLGEAESRTLTSFQEVPDIGHRWTLVASYGGQEVHRQELAREDLAAADWTVVVPVDATVPLERAGFL
jgi:hypothetical protein